jgi:hypothetical protein
MEIEYTFESCQDEAPSRSLKFERAVYQPCLSDHDKHNPWFVEFVINRHIINQVPSWRSWWVTKVKFFNIWKHSCKSLSTLLWIGIYWVPPCGLGVTDMSRQDTFGSTKSADLSTSAGMTGIRPRQTTLRRVWLPVKTWFHPCATKALRMESRVVFSVQMTVLVLVWSSESWFSQFVVAFADEECDRIKLFHGKTIENFEDTMIIDIIQW